MYFQFYCRIYQKCAFKMCEVSYTILENLVPIANSKNTNMHQLAYPSCLRQWVPVQIVSSGNRDTLKNRRPKSQLSGRAFHIWATRMFRPLRTDTRKSYMLNNINRIVIVKIIYLPTVSTVRYFCSVILLPTGRQNIYCLVSADPNICEVHFMYWPHRYIPVTGIPTGLSILVGSIPSTYRTISKPDLTYHSAVLFFQSLL